MSEEIEIARQWAAKASSDLLNADNNLKSKLVPFDTVCFHCQQALEWSGNMKKLNLPKFNIPVLKEKQLPPEIFYEQIIRNIQYLHKSGQLDRILKQSTRRPVNTRFVAH